jgi:bleomycin hydrolase
MKHSTEFKILTAMHFILVFSFSPLLANETALTEDIISRIRTSFEMDLHNRAVYNAVTNKDVKNLALNREIVSSHDKLYSKKINVKGITNQKSSGRCWLFAGLNHIRYHVIKKHELKKFEFSQIYLTFWDKLEKANTFLEYIIEFRDRDILDRELEFALKYPCPDGGYWENVVDLINKYGVIPQDAMPETNSSNSTGSMNRILNTKLRADAVKLRKMNQEGNSLQQLRAEKEKMLAEVYKILVINLGAPPKEFTWRYEDKKKKDKDSEKEDDDDDEDNDDADDDDADDEDEDDENENDKDEDESNIKVITTTPKCFWEEFVEIDLSEWVNIFNDTIHDYGNHYQIRMSHNIHEGSNINYVNIDIEMLKEIAVKSLLDDTPVMFAADVSYDQSGDLGIMAINLYDYDPIYGIDTDMTKPERALFRSSVRNHGMVFTGIDIQNDKPVKWQVENSWGSDKGDSGYWAMYDSWFEMHVYNIIVKKEYVPEEILEMFQKPPVILPPWDPML